MIISQPTETTYPRRRLPDSAQSSLVLTLSKGIRAIRLFIDRHHSGQHTSYTCAWILARKNGIYVFVLGVFLVEMVKVSQLLDHRGNRIRRMPCQL